MPEIELPEPGEFIPYGASWWRGMIDMMRKWPRRMLQRTNGIANLILFNCNGHFFAYVRTFLPPAGDLAMSFLVIDPDDLLRGWLKGSGYRSRIKMYGSPAKTKRAYNMPEIGEEIGKRLPFSGKVAGTRLGRGLKWAFMVDAWVQEALLYFVIFDQITKFLFGWSSGLIALEECRRGGVYLRGGNYGAPGGEGDQQIPLGGGFTEVISSGSLDGTVYLAGNWIENIVPMQMVVSMRMSGVFPLGCWFWYKIYCKDDTGRIWWQSIPVRTDWGAENDSTTVSQHLPPGRYGLFYEIWGTGCYTAMLNFGFVVAKPIGGGGFT